MREAFANSENYISWSCEKEGWPVGQALWGSMCNSKRLKVKELDKASQTLTPVHGF